ncbi:MAG TPA: M20/M25/M40 family metallo-hydrolase [Gemmataceae bacterium]|nr:M20/M25/M40 family metallo-hydrolase [Gemmataceae bacterium]
MDALFTLAIALIVWPQVDPFAAEAELSEDITAAELRAHVYRLASPEFLGRKGPGAARASRHVAQAFQRLHLEPAFGSSFFQPIPSPLADEDDPRGNYVGRNVAAVLPGSDPTLGDEWVLLSAHFDHLGKHGNVLYPGADDNATGVAMLLEVAERFALRKEKPKRTLVFVAFDQEETGLLGSSYFATHAPRPFRQLKAFLTADMLGRSMANVMDEYVFALGSERSPGLRKLLEEVKPPAGLRVGRLGADLVGTRSDYGPFRDRRVPFLFFSTGQHPDYHSPNDLPERIDYEKLRRICLWISELVDRLANDEAAPTWDAKPAPPELDEARTVLELVRRVLAQPTRYPLTLGQRDLVGGVEKRLADILDRGRVTDDERGWLVRTARILMLTVF